MSSFLGFLLAFSISPFGASAQQNYTFAKVLDFSTQRPDGAGRFNINSVTTPSFDGQWVVFRDSGLKDDGSQAALWSYNTADKSFHKLVDFNTTVPGGTGKFFNLQLEDTAPVVRNGIVVFLGRDTTLAPGLYSVAASGGAITKLADSRTANPSGGTFTVFDASGKQAGGFSFDGKTVVFSGQGSAGTLGIYAVKPDGTGLAVVADTLHPYSAQNNSKVAAFYAPAVSGGNVLLVGTDGGDPKVGYNGLYLGGISGNDGVSELANSGQPLPGDTNTPFHTRFDSPANAMDGTLAVYRGSDAAAPVTSPMFGLYSMDVSSKKTTRIADVNTALAGLGRLRSIADGGVAVSQGNVLFRAADDAGKSALYVWSSGGVTRVIGTGDALDSQTTQSVFEAGPAALSGSGFAFTASSLPAGYGIYVAKPAATTMTVTSVGNGASYSTSSVAPGEIVTIFGKGLGPATLVSYALDGNNRIPTTLGGAQILFNNYAAPLIYVSDQQSAAIVPFEIAGLSSVDVKVQYGGATSAAVTVPVTNTMPGVFSADASGSGPGAIQHTDYTLNSAANPAPAGAVVVLWLSGLGPFSTSVANGSVITATPLPNLAFAATVTIGGKAAQVLYGGAAPGSVAGLYQINCVIPDGLPAGPAAVVVTSDGKQSQPNLTVAVR